MHVIYVNSKETIECLQCPKTFLQINYLTNWPETKLMQNVINQNRDEPQISSYEPQAIMDK